LFGQSAVLHEPEASPEIHKSGHRLADLAVALSALFISLCSLGLAVHSAHTMERLVEANSRPFLKFTSGNGYLQAGTGFVSELRVTIENPGAGAARVERFSIVVDGQPASDVVDAIRRLKKRAIADHVLGDTAAGTGSLEYSDAQQWYLRAGSEEVMLRWPRTDANAALWDYVDKARQGGRVGLQACYCSIFDECWIATTKSLRPKSVKSC
jgi:hypothetical protein